MSTHNIGFYEAEAILMSTHNIGFYEDLTKIIFELSSNIIKYAPYFFCFKTVRYRKERSIFSCCKQQMRLEKEKEICQIHVC